MSANVGGDIGGSGISRMHFGRTDGTAPSVTDCNAAAAAWQAMWGHFNPYIPLDIAWTWQPVVTLIESTSAQLQGYLNLSALPSPVTGVGSGNYAAGNGLRIDWRTVTINGRRQMRAANYMVPLAAAGFATNGGIASALLTSAQTWGLAFLSALGTAGMELVAYHRPAKGATVGGMFGPVVALNVPNVPSTLRSRRI
jgi:hypothetical protein